MPTPIAPGFRIGPIAVNPPLLLAPMEDVSSLPMRVLTKRIAGPGLMFTEFISAMAVHYNATKSLRKMRIDEGERPLGIQIFGGEPDVMAETARVVQDAGADLVDINMGCWVPKVCRQGSGAALLKDPDLATEIVSAVVKAVDIPVTVKVRAGWDYSLFAAPELARRFQEAGAQMITLHARFAKQGFEGQANWDLIRDMREAVTVPLIGNGDVREPDDAVRMIRETGCDGVMVGRGAIGNPWALARIRAAMMGEPIPAEPTIDERVHVAREHAAMAVRIEEEETESTGPDTERRALSRLRGILPLYIKGEPGASQLRARLSRVCSRDELDQILLGFLEERTCVR